MKNILKLSKLFVLLLIVLIASSCLIGGALQDTSYTNNTQDSHVKDSGIDGSMYELTVASNVKGAQVFINGEYFGSTELVVSLRSDIYRIEVSMPDHQTYIADIKLNKPMVIFAELEKK